MANVIVRKKNVKQIGTSGIEVVKCDVDGSIGIICRDEPKHGHKEIEQELILTKLEAETIVKWINELIEE